MDPNRKTWNEQQKALLQSLTQGDYTTAQALFARHHAMVHSGRMSGLGIWSFEDEVLDDLSESEFRRIPQNEEHSIAWNIWHIARIEDVTMNLLVAGDEQLYFSKDWFSALNIPYRHAGNGMPPSEIAELSEKINLEALRDYRIAVGQKTRQVVGALTETDYKQRVDASRLDRVMREGAVPESAHEIISYWGKRDIAGLLLMPATRHNFLHLNECLRLKNKRA